MVYEIEWTIQALVHLEDIKEYIAKDSLFYAEKTVRVLYSHADKLSKYPEIGMIVKEQEGYVIRRILIKSYRIVYAFYNHTIYIIAVSHQHQLYPDSYDYLKDYLG